MTRQPILKRWFWLTTIVVAGAAGGTAGFWAAQRMGARAGKSAAVVAAVNGPLQSLAALKNFRAERASSASRRTNKDYRRIEPRHTVTVADLKGPGEITHIWMTVKSKDPRHLRDLVLRIYYNGEPFPSVESPLGDFFGLGFATYYVFSNPVQAIGTDKGLNCFWPMPFERSVRIEVSNESDIPTDRFYYYVDWRRYHRLPTGLGYFHAQYRQAFPCPNGKPYLLLETDGCPGHYVGANLSVHTQVPGWWGEGDDIFTIDGETSPSLWGTGTEDYFGGAWDYGKTFYNDYFGLPYRQRMDYRADNRWNVYRLHLESPIPFQKSLKIELEHGYAGYDETRRGGHNNDYASVAYWYMEKPVRLIGALPPAKDRISLYRPTIAPANVVKPQNTPGRIAPDRGVELKIQDMDGYTLDTGNQWLFGDQLLCSPNVMGSEYKTTFTLTSPESGPAVFRLTQASDFGRIQIVVDGAVVVPDFDGYHRTVRAVLVRGKTISLAAGTHTLAIRTLGKDPRSANVFWGIDYMRIGGKPLKIETSTPQAPAAPLSKPTN